MARRSGLGKGLGALIPPATRPTSAPTARRRCVEIAGRRRSRPTRTSRGCTSTRRRSASWPRRSRELGVLQPVLVRALGDERLRADRRRAPLAGGQAGRAADHPGASCATTDDARLARAGAGREPPPRGPQPARGGGRLPAADRGLRASPTRRSPSGSARAARRSPTRCACSGCRRRSSTCSPTASCPPATPGRCSARRTARSRSAGPPGRRRRAGRCATVEEAVRSRGSGGRRRPRRRRRGRADRRRRPRRRRPRLRPPGLLELEELLADAPRHPRRRADGRQAGQGDDRLRRPRGPRADLPADHRRALTSRASTDVERRDRSSSHRPAVTRIVHALHTASGQRCGYRGRRHCVRGEARASRRRRRAADRRGGPRRQRRRPRRR